MVENKGGSKVDLKRDRSGGSVRVEGLGGAEIENSLHTIPHYVSYGKLFIDGTLIVLGLAVSAALATQCYLG
jgi:hypothetical protein